MKSSNYPNPRYPIVKVISHRPTFRSNTPIWRVTSILFAFVATLCVLFADDLPAQDIGKAQPTLPGVKLVIGGKTLKTEVAATDQQRYMGLSFRTSMATDAGMLFVYDAERPLTFTMRNTLIPSVHCLYFSRLGHQRNTRHECRAQSIVRFQAGRAVRIGSQSGLV